MSTEFTKTVDDNPHGERILYLLSAVLFNIQGNYASLRAKPVHISGHLPLPNVTRSPDGKLAESSDKFAPIIGFWVQGLDKKNSLCLGLLEERKFQGKKPKSAMHLLLEK